MMKYDPANVARTLRLLLHVKGVSQSELARCTGIKQSAISRFLNAKNCNAEVSTILKFCDYFKVTPNFLLNFADDFWLNNNHIMDGLCGIARAAILARRAEQACIDADIDGGVIYDIASHLENALGDLSADRDTVTGALLPELERALYKETMTAESIAVYIYNQIKEAKI